MMRRSIGRMLRILGATAIVASTITASTSPAGAQGGASISGGGASFPQLEIEQWRADTARPPYNLKVDFQAAGSTFGRTQFLLGQFDWGQSDIAFQPDEDHLIAASSRKNFVYVPISAGGIGFMYNVTGTDGRRITNLRLSQSNVCRLFTEEEIFWDDPAIVAENPGVPLPHNAARPFVRSDGAGTSYNLSAYCITTAPDVWGRFVQVVTTRYNYTAPIFASGLPVSQWPPPLKNGGAYFASDGVANAVANDVSGQNSITYNEAGFALERGFPNAAVRNAAGQYLLPNPANVSTALAYAAPRADGTFTLQFNAPDPAAYFPSAYSYAICQTTGFDPAKGQTLATFLNYAVTAGQKRAEPLGYARLSNILVNLALDQIVKIPGAPPRPTDLAGAPPPPAVVNAPAGSPGAAAGGGKAPAGGAAAAAGGGAAKPGAKPGATGGASGDPAAAASDPAAAAAADAAAASAAVGVTDEGVPQLDVSKLPDLALDPKLDAETTSAGGPASTGFSNGEALGAFALGFVLVAFGTFGGSGGGWSSKRKGAAA